MSGVDADEPDRPVDEVGTADIQIAQHVERVLVEVDEKRGAPARKSGVERGELVIAGSGREIGVVVLRRIGCEHAAGKQQGEREGSGTAPCLEQRRYSREGEQNEHWRTEDERLRIRPHGANACHRKTGEDHQHQPANECVATATKQMDHAQCRRQRGQRDQRVGDRECDTRR